jgi:hypothetical protein
MIFTYKTADQITFPVFLLPSDNWHAQDGLVYVDNGLVDDLNMPGSTLGIRRLQTPQDGLLPLKRSVFNLIGILKQTGHHFIDSAGVMFTYEKTKHCSLKYYRIKKVERKTVASLLWVEGIKSPFTIPRPPDEGCIWAGILHLHDLPWMLYEYSKGKLPNTHRKV